MKAKICISLDEQTVKLVDQLAQAVGGKRSTIIQKVMNQWTSHGQLLLRTMNPEQLRDLVEHSGMWIKFQADPDDGGKDDRING